MNTLDQLKLYAEAGFKIFPVWGVDSEGKCLCGDEHLKDHSAGKHPRFKDWEKIATDSIDTIETWYKYYPTGNWGLATGKLSNVTVVDIDPKNGGSIDSLPFPETLTVQTGSGGYHLYYLYNSMAGTGVENLAKGIDVRNDGALVVIPPSMHITGNEYKWANQSNPVPFPVGLIPEKKEKPTIASPKRDINLAVDIPKAKEALGRLSQERVENYAEWIQVGQALYSLGKEGLELWDNWSKKSTKYQPDVCAEKWETFSEEGLSLASLFYWAKEDNPKQALQIRVEGEILNTDLGNALRLLKKYGDVLRYNKSFHWVIWNGKKWEINSPHSHSYAQKVAQDIYLEAAAVQNNKDLAEAIANWAKQSQNTGRLNNMLEEAKTHIYASTEQFDDNHHWLLNVENGILNLRTKELIEHDPNYYMTRIMPVEFDEEAKCPHWLEFMELIFPDPQVRAYVQKAVGVSLTGNSDEKALFFLWGESGDNGKSTFIRALLNLFGDYGNQTEATVIMALNTGGLTPLNESFYNTRFITADELNKNDKLSEAKVKRLTGNDIITCNPKNRDPFNFKPTHNLWIFGNNKPSFDGTDKAMVNRIKLIGFDSPIPPEIRRRPEAVLQEFIDENSGILNWALEGLAAYLEEGLVEPERIVEDVGAYQRENDPFAVFINDECELGDTFSIRKDELLTTYNLYLKANLEKLCSNKSLTAQLKKIGIYTGGQGRKNYIGIRLLQSEPVSDETIKLESEVDSILEGGL